MRVGRATEAIVYFAAGNRLDRRARSCDRRVGGAPACRPEKGTLVIRRALLVAVVVGGLVIAAAAPGTAAASSGQGDRSHGRPRGVRLPVGLEERHARPDLRRRARRRRRARSSRAGRSWPSARPTRRPAREVAELRPRAVERHQRGERVTRRTRQGGRRDAHVLGLAVCRTASSAVSSSITEQQLAADQSRGSDRVGEHLGRPGDRRAHRRRSSGVPGHRSTWPSRTEHAGDGVGIAWARVGERAGGVLVDVRHRHLRRRCSPPS